MKRSLMLVAALITLTAGQGLFPAPAAARGDGPMEGGRFQERMAAILDLSEAQQEQIEAIRERYQATLEPLRQSKRATRDRIDALTDAVPFDEAAVRALAAEQAATHAELIVTMARMRSEIHAVFTPEQRERAARLRDLKDRERGPRQGGRGMGPERGEDR